MDLLMTEKWLLPLLFPRKPPGVKQDDTEEPLNMFFEENGYQ
jgi:hypothetical protein